MRHDGQKEAEKTRQSTFLTFGKNKLNKINDRCVEKTKILLNSEDLEGVFLTCSKINHLRIFNLSGAAGVFQTEELYSHIKTRFM